MPKRPGPQPTDLAPLLLPWFDREQRALPWRGVADPYRIWVSEIMLQQTQVTTVLPYYERFLETFPTVQDLAAADLEGVLGLWQGLGYYSRARHLHAAAQLIVAQHGGQFPATYAEARALPGVGSYAAGAILSIAYGVPLPALDGNAYRVLARVFAVKGEIASGPAKRHLNALGKEAVPHERPGDYNQALMELGAQVCLPRGPRCAECCLAEICQARARGLAESVPEIRRAPTREVKTVVALLQRDHAVLVAKRPATGVWGGLWEFPNCEGADAEALQEYLARHFGVLVTEPKEFARLTHGIMDQRITLTAYRCDVIRGRAHSAAHEALAWVRPDGLDAYPLPAPHHKLAEKLQATSHKR